MLWRKRMRSCLGLLWSHEYLQQWLHGGLTHHAKASEMNCRQTPFRNGQLRKLLQMFGHKTFRSGQTVYPSYRPRGQSERSLLQASQRERKSSTAERQLKKPLTWQWMLWFITNELGQINFAPWLPVSLCANRSSASLPLWSVLASNAICLCSPASIPFWMLDSSAHLSAWARLKVHRQGCGWSTATHRTPANSYMLFMIHLTIDHAHLAQAEAHKVSIQSHHSQGESPRQ